MLQVRHSSIQSPNISNFHFNDTDHEKLSISSLSREGIEGDSKCWWLLICYTCLWSSRMILKHKTGLVQKYYFRKYKINIVFQEKQNFEFSLWHMLHLMHDIPIFLCHDLNVCSWWFGCSFLELVYFVWFSRKWSKRQTSQALNSYYSNHNPMNP